MCTFCFFFSSRRRHTRWPRDWSSDVCSSDLNDVAALSPKQVQYTFMCYEDGGTVDDLLIYKLDIDHYLLVVNASNLDKDLAWLHQHNTYKEEDVMIKDESAQYRSEEHTSELQSRGHLVC